LGELHLDPKTAALLVSGVADEAGDSTQAKLSSKRDAMIAAMQVATREIRKS